MASPKVFASYSHDSCEHKEWVQDLCAKLRKNGVDVTLDLWDLRPGGDLPPFIEKAVRDADRVIVICTPYYVKKANVRKRGVGYEASMITAELYHKETTKFIPVIRQSSGDKKTPVFLGTRVYIDFTDDSQFDAKFDELLREIHQAQRIRKPPLGRNPFAGQTSASGTSSGHLPEIPEKIESASHAYRLAIEFARAGDTIGWQQLLKKIRPDAFRWLVQWRQKELDPQPPGNMADRFQAVNKAVDIVAPLISIALAGVESGNERFNDQNSLLSDLLTIRGWQGDNKPWHQTWVQIPYALGYVYHSLHGALCLNTKQLGLALGLARKEVPFAIGDSGPTRVWENAHLIGYCALLRDHKEIWKYLASAYGRWEWLQLIFEDDFEDDFTYRASLVAYYMALSIHELAVAIASPNSTSYVLPTPSVPWDFLSEAYEIKEHATTLLHNDPELPKLWTCLGVTQEQMREAWDSWRDQREVWLFSNYQFHEAGEFLVTTPKYLEFFDRLPRLS